jgi:putative endopeptidase
MKINVGYPDKWEDMDKYVNIDESKSLRENYDAIIPALRKAELEKYWKKPVDKTIMACNPQIVNAFYSPAFNSINFPAAILQAPFFDANAEDAVNYGGIGTVIGHEMSHGFDDQGCQYDKDGNLRNWWTEEDKTNYDKRTKVLADWFSQQEVQPGLKVDGNKTLGENIGDNGGINIAFRAFQNVAKQNPEDTKDLEGFTPAQRFFLSYGRIWASNVAPQFVAYLVNSDTHSPNAQRVNAALPMIDAWYDAFNIKVGDKLYVPIDNRAHIW